MQGEWLKYFRVILCTLLTFVKASVAILCFSLRIFHKLLLYCIESLGTAGRQLFSNIRTFTFAEIKSSLTRRLIQDRECSQIFQRNCQKYGIDKICCLGSSKMLSKSDVVSYKFKVLLVKYRR